MQRWKNYLCPVSGQTGAEEFANTLTHALGFLFSLIALPILIFDASHNGLVHIVSNTIFGLSMALLYGASTSYHFAICPFKKRTMKIIDHSFIYLLIAGTYTPFMLVVLKNSFGFALLAIVWIMAAIGIVFKLFFTGRFRVASTLAYLAMGWVAVIAFPYLVERVSAMCLSLMAVGGISYTLGTIFYLWRSLPFNHAVWHLFVLTGSVCHFAAILLIS